MKLVIYGNVLCRKCHYFILLADAFVCADSVSFNRKTRARSLPELAHYCSIVSLIRDNVTHAVVNTDVSILHISSELQSCRNREPDREEYLKMATFNYRLSRARRLIENAFGIMASRWRILRRAFRASEETTENIVKACVALHNFLLKNSAMSRSAYNPPGYVDSEDWQGNLTHGSWRNDDRGLPLRDMAGLGSHSPG